MKINKYPDGTSYVIEDDFDRVITFKTNNYEDLHHLEQYVDVCNYNGYTPTIVIPNLIDAQADRRFKNNHSSGLKIVCKRLNSMDANFKIFHPHNPEVVEALIDNVEIVENVSFISKVLKEVGRTYHNSSSDNLIKLGTEIHVNEHIDKNLILMSSDAGGFKPLMKLCDKIKWQGETYSASKARNNETGKLTQIIDRQDFKGKDILIVDDISVYGGTFKGLATMLRERNCGKLYLAVSHMTVQNLGKDSVTKYFDKVFTTNSKFDSYGVSNKDGQPDQPRNLEIIKLF